MHKTVLALTVLGAGLLAGHAHANNACLLETNTTVMGVPLEVKDCIQNSGMSARDFQAQCNGMSQAVVSMGGPPAQITFLAACPTPFQARCDVSGTARSIFYYYKREADTMDSLKMSCEQMMRGTYTRGTLR